jgi:hypothetical protein
MTRRPLPLLCLFLAGLLLGFQVGRSLTPEPPSPPDAAPVAAQPPPWQPFGAARAWVFTCDGVPTELQPGSSCRWEGNRPGQVIVVDP